MRAKLIVVLAGWLASCAVWADGNFDPPLGKKPVPRGRPTDTTTDSPERVHFGVDFSATRTPLAPAKDVSPRQDRRQAAVDRPADAPVQAGVTNGYASRSADQPVQGKWEGNSGRGQ